MLNLFQWSCRLHTFHWTAHTRDGLLQPFGDFICTGPECHICSKQISISTTTFSITTATLCKPYWQFWCYQRAKHWANRNSGEVRLKLCYMIFHYSYISVKNKSNNKTTEHKYRQPVPEMDGRPVAKCD
jgi:hypothetical protein